jgi:putative hydrolase of the HAD superfamily
MNEMLAGRFKAVLFDLGGTLVKHEDGPVIHRRILEDNGIDVSLEAVTRAHNENERELDMNQIPEQGQAFWIKWNIRLLESLGIEKNKEILARKIDKEWLDYCTLEVYPDVIETLVQLRKRGIKTGIITNAFERDFQRILSQLKLSDFFDIVVGTDTCKKIKPDKGIFLYTVGRLGIKPDEALFVGDSLENDFEGAKNSGLTALLIDRENKSKIFGSIQSLTDVLRHV